MNIKKYINGLIEIELKKLTQSIPVLYHSTNFWYEMLKSNEIHGITKQSIPILNKFNLR